MITIFLLFQVKHFIADFLLQTKYQYLNKGKFLHAGGLWHASIHGAWTFLILYHFADLKLLILLSLFDFVSHYLIDYSKVNLTKKYKWSFVKDGKLVITSNNFFIALGVDQLLHQLTYCLILYFL
jgi:hypothetical protein